MYRWMLRGWVVAMVFALPSRVYGQSMQPEDYTCSKVRGTNKKLKLSDIQKGWDDVKRRIKSREEALEYFRKLQDYSFQEAMETGTYASTWISIAFRVVGQYLTCDDKLKIIQRDLEFYRKHEDMLYRLPGTYPWHLEGMECAKDFIRSELKKKNLSRMYRGWLIVQASYFWYEEFRDSLLAVIQDFSFHPDFRRKAMQLIPEKDYQNPSVLKTMVHVLEHDTSYVWLSTGISSEKQKFYPTIAMALRILSKANRQDLVPEKYREWLKPRKVDSSNPTIQKMPSTDTGRIEVAVYFDKDAMLADEPAWFWYWLQVLESRIPMGDLEIQYAPYGACGSLGSACYFWNTPYIILTSEVSQKREIGEYKRTGIDFMAVAIYHEKAHKDLFDNVWRYLICSPPDYTFCDLSLEAKLMYDRDTTYVNGDLIMDLLPDQWEREPHQVGNLLIQFDTTWPTTATFYNSIETDGELWAMLHECLWQEGSVDSLDWSWGPYAKQMDIELDPIPSPPDYEIIHPVGDNGRRWVYDPSINKLKVVVGKIPAERGVPIQANALNDSIQGFEWVVELWGNISREWTEPGEVKFMELTPVVPLWYGEFGKKILKVIPKTQLCVNVETQPRRKNGQEGVPVTADILLHFTRPMDTSSVRAGLSISPSFLWQWEVYGLKDFA